MTSQIDVLNFDSIIMDLKSNSPKQVFQHLATHVHHLIGTPENKIIDELLEQEKNISSAIGGGVSIPHMRLPRLTQPMIVFAKLTNPVDFKSNDGELVDFVCLILSPDFEGMRHLQRLSMVTRCFIDQEFCELLREAKDIEDIKLALRHLNAKRLAA